MNLTVNGNPHRHAADGTLGALLKELGADPARVAILVNERVIRREDRDAVRLKEGDRLEILAFVGGG